MLWVSDCKLSAFVRSIKPFVTTLQRHDSREPTRDKCTEVTVASPDSPFELLFKRRFVYYSCSSHTMISTSEKKIHFYKYYITSSLMEMFTTLR